MEKRPESEREQGGVCGGVWREGGRGSNYDLNKRMKGKEDIHHKWTVSLPRPKSTVSSCRAVDHFTVLQFFQWEVTTSIGTT